MSSVLKYQNESEYQSEVAKYMYIYVYIQRLKEYSILDCLNREYKTGTAIYIPF